MIVYTYHKNLKFENFTTKIVLPWRLMLEEYRPEIKYIKGPDKDALDTLSRMRFIKSEVTESNVTREQLEENYGVN